MEITFQYAMLITLWVIKFVLWVAEIVGSVCILYSLFMHNPLRYAPLLWGRYVAPRVREGLGLNSEYPQPVGGFVAPYVLIVLFLVLFTGMLPYGPGYATNFKLVFIGSFSIWLMTFLYVLMTERFFTGLWKGEIGFLLAFFLYVIELLRTFVKPVTLTVRLYANVMFGHYILAFVFHFLLKFRGVWFFWLAIPFVVFETLVCLVQAYIFTYLIVSYLGELQ